MESKTSELLKKTDKGISTSVGILSKVFRTILKDLNIGPEQWIRLMSHYLENPINRVPNNSRGRSSTRGNLNKELTKTNMTWGNFEKGIRFIDAERVEFIVKITDKKGVTSIHNVCLLDHSKGVELPEAIDEDEED